MSKFDGVRKSTFVTLHFVDVIGNILARTSKRWNHQAVSQWIRLPRKKNIKTSCVVILVTSKNDAT